MRDLHVMVYKSGKCMYEEMNNLSNRNTNESIVSELKRCVKNRKG